MDDDTYADDDLWDSLPPDLLTQLDSLPQQQQPPPPQGQGQQQRYRQHPQHLPPPPRASQLPLKRPPPPPAFAPAPAPTQTQRFAPAPPLYGTAKPSGILRPAQPPQRKKPRLDAPPPPQAFPPTQPQPPPPAAPAPSAPAPADQPQRTVGPGRYGSRNERGEPGFVDPNPWAAGRGAAATSAAAAAQVKVEGATQAGAGGPRGKEGHAGGAEEEEEEDLPAIQLDEAALLALDSAATGAGGVYRAEPQRGVTVAGAGGARGGALPAQQARGASPLPGPPPPPPPPAGRGKGVEEKGEAERRELEALRAEKAKLQQALAASQADKARLETEVATKMGENRIVRGKLSKAEAAHAAALKLEKRDRQQLQDELEKKEKEYKASVERMKMEEAFRRQELATASVPRHRSSSQRPPSTGQGLPTIGSANSQRFYQRAATGAPTSPSLGRSRSERAASARPGAAVLPPPPQPAFGAGGSGFNAAPPAAPRQKGAEGFAPSQSQALPRRGAEREGSMGPPRQAGPGAGVGAGRKSAEKDRVKGGKKDAKGKEREKGLQLEEDEGFFGGGAEGVGEAVGEEGEQGGSKEEAEPDDLFPWEWVPPVRDERAELLAAVFAHTSLAAVEVEPAAGSLPHPPHAAAHGAHPHPHGRGRQSFPPSTSSRHASTAPASRALSTPHPSSFHPSTPAAPAAPVIGPLPTLHALLNLRFPPTTPPALVAHYESTSRSLFSLLGRVVDPSLSSLSHPHAHSHSHPTADDLPPALAAHLTTLLLTLDAARLPAGGAMTALLKLVSALVFAFPEFGHACATAVGEVPAVTVAVGSTASAAGVAGGRGTQMMSVASTAAAGGAAAEGGSEKEKKRPPKMDRVPLLPLLARLIARYGRPFDPPPTASSASRLGTSPSTASASASSAAGRPSLLLRSRKARLARPIASSASSSSSSGAGGKDKPDEVERVPLERAKRERLLEAVLGVVEGVGWRVAARGEAGEGGGGGDEVREGEDAFIAFVRTPCAVATLLDPRQPVGILLSAVRVLALFACRPPLFRPLLGVKFYDAPDTKNSKLPLVDRITTLLAMPRSADSPAAHTLDLSLLSLSLRLLTKHEDALMLVVQSASFVPEVLAKMWRDVRTVWEWDGREGGGKAAEGLKRTTLRLSHLVHLLYYLAHAPHSSLTIGDLLTGGPANASFIHPYQLQAVNDLFTSALGTLAFATIGGAAAGGVEEEGAMPSWTGEEGFEGERERLVELGYLAQELLEDVSPLELEEVEVCFGPPDAEEDGDEEDEDDEMEEEVGMMVDGMGEEQRVAESQA